MEVRSHTKMIVLLSCDVNPGMLMAAGRQDIEVSIKRMTLIASLHLN